MEYSNLVILIPGYSLEDLPSSMEDAQAASLLNAFAVAWHPLLLAKCKGLPRWHRADSPPEAGAGSLVFVPLGSRGRLPEGWADQARDRGAVVLDGLQDRAEMVAAVLATVPEWEELAGRLDPDLTADFHALATAYVMMELLTRRMYYYNDLDEVYLQRESVSAAEAALAQDTATAREHLKNCFVSFKESRERFHPVDSFLIDLCLLSSETEMPRLRERLQAGVPINFLISAHDLERLAVHQPQTIGILREAWDQGTADFCGGEYEETVPALVPLESLLWQFAWGRRVFESLLGRRPTVWGRKLFGLSPGLPQILKRFGYRGALHVLLDHGTYPEGNQSKIRWKGCDESVIEAIARVPLPAEKATSYLNLPVRMAEAMEQDQSGAAVLLVRPPDSQPAWLEDLRRMQRYASVLGTFVTLSEFFEKTDAPGRLSAFEAKQYLSPELQQSLARNDRNPLSRYADHARRRQHFACAQWCHALANVLRGNDAEGATDAETERLIEAAGAELLPETIDRAETLLREYLATSGRELADIVMQGVEVEPGHLVINPLSFPRTVTVDLAGCAGTWVAGAESSKPQTGDTEGPGSSGASKTQPQPPGPRIGGPVLGVQFDQTHRVVTVEVPGSGFVWIPNRTAGVESPSRSDSPQIPLVDGNRLRNEFFEAYIHEEHGGLQRLRTYRRDANRLSQQVALRFPFARRIPSSDDSGESVETFYSRTRCRSLEVTSNGPELGEITTTGELIDPQSGVRLAEFRQVFRVWRRRPVLELDIDLDIQHEPESSAWYSYYACRFAWNDSTAALTRSQLDAAQAVGGERIESLHYLEIANEDGRTTLYGSALPFHRKVGPRMLDTLLVTAGEQQRHFRFWIAVDQEYPMQTAWDLLTPAPVIPTTAGPPRVGQTGWFFHLDARNVQITRLMNVLPEPTPPVPSQENGASSYQDDQSRETGTGSDQDDRCLSQFHTPAKHGFALRLVETEGRGRMVNLRCFRTPVSARQRDFDGKTIQELLISDDRVCLEMGAYAFADVEVLFDNPNVA